MTIARVDVYEDYNKLIPDIVGQVGFNLMTVDHNHLAEIVGKEVVRAINQCRDRQINIVQGSALQFRVTFHP